LIYDAIVLGGGAAGLFCAAVAGARGKRLLVLEHNPECGRKILISGGGRCNFTNLEASATNFLSRNLHFAKSALARYTPQDFIDLVKRHKIRFHEKTLGQLFCDGSSREIVDLLLEECRSSGVEVRTGCRAGSVSRGDSFRVQTSQGEFESAAVVIATGGLSIPKMGATGFGYDIARQFGLKIVDPYPALVPLTLDAESRGRWCDLAGVSAEVVARCGKREFREKLLITHRGLSGPAVLQISSYWKKPEPVIVDLLPGRSVERADPAKLRQELSWMLPARFAERWLGNEGFTQPVLPAKRVDERIHRWTVTPDGTEGFAKAEVTGGGVATSELQSATMEAVRVPGLYFIGEVVDVTGWLGGYNFQWAWSSGYAAGLAVAGASS
jgi:predicted Rossmann fold flavoprotein